MPFQWLEQAAAVSEVLGCPAESGEVRADVRSQEPRPHRSLVVGRVALPGTAALGAAALAGEMSQLAGGKDAAACVSRWVMLIAAKCPATRVGGT